MTYSFSLILTIAITFLGAGFIKGVTGMGLPTVAMGILGALISPLAAASLLIIPSFVTNLWQLLAGPSFCQLVVRLWSMMLAIGVGSIAGTAVLVGGNIAVTTSMLGSSLVIYAAYTLFARELLVPGRLERLLSPFIGLLTGLIAGATGIFVIPAVPYLQSLGLRKDDLVQSLGLSFTVSTAALAVGLSSREAYSGDLLLVSVLSVVPSLAGMFIGQAYRRKIRPDNFRRWFLIGLLVLGLEMALRPLFSMS